MDNSVYFRAGIGIVLYDTQHYVYAFNRVDNESIWQFPQGGIDRGETLYETLFRELTEETGLTRHDVTSVTEYPRWLYYEYDTAIQQKQAGCLGQIHRWYFLKIKPGHLPSLDQVEHPEFCSYKKIEFRDLIATTTSFKKNVYHELYTFFTDHI